MNIGGISNPSQPDSVGDIGEAPRGRVRQGRFSGVGGDQVVMSDISQAMGRGLKDLKSDLSPRPEKMAQFRDQADNPVSLSDSVITTILKKIYDV